MSEARSQPTARPLATVDAYREWQAQAHGRHLAATVKETGNDSDKELRRLLDWSELRGLDRETVYMWFVYYALNRD